MKKIVILERLDEPSDYNFRVAFRIIIPAAKQLFYSDGTKTSAYPYAAAALIAAIQAGQVEEVVEVMHWTRDASGNPPPLNAVAADMETRYNQIQTEMNTRNPWVRYGTSWDGSAWTQEGVVL